MLVERIRQLAIASSCVILMHASAHAAPAPIGAGSHPISPSLAAFWFVEKADDAVKTLPVIVFLEGAPAWVDQPTKFDWSVTTTPATIDFTVGKTPIRARYWADRGRIEIAGRTIEIASHNAILVTGIDGGHPVVSGLGRHDLVLPADHETSSQLLGHDHDLVAALLHESASPAPRGKARWAGTHQHALALTKIGNPDSDRVALALWREAADAQDAAAQYRIGVCYGTGRGTDVDQATANGWYQKAAEQGYVDAQYKLAYSYATGRGCAIDTAAAMKWYTRAADQGDHEAQYQMATMYSHGGRGLADPVRALQWYQKSAEGDDAAGQYETARRYLDGVGTPPDVARAFAWWQVLQRSKDSFAPEAANMVSQLGQEVQARLDAPARKRAETARAEMLAVISRRTLEAYRLR